MKKDILKIKVDEVEIDKLRQEGHSRHCACRIVWGDGECVCNKRGDLKKENLKKLIELIKKA